ncbi:MAG TPA: hypothetical protein VMW62_06930 [Chloroflexota bacterium]|nr:hypothetical protein [Chloroflexota bacterium]
MAAAVPAILAPRRTFLVVGPLAVLIAALLVQFVGIAGSARLGQYLQRVQAR